MNTSARIATPSKRKSGRFTAAVILSAASGWRAILSAADAAKRPIPNPAPITVRPNPTGTNTVASLVCFIDAKPRKSEYRKFKVKTIDGIDDFASMREIVHRRYKRVKKEGTGLPDLILIDGGKGQLSMAVSALRELGLDYLPIIGLAKRLEEVFIPGNSDPQSIHKQSPGLFLLRRIRDEAHRFAISFQKQQRKAAISKSIFHSIKGMGEKRVKMLLKQYSDVKMISNLSPKMINKDLGIAVKIAKEIISKAKSQN